MSWSRAWIPARKAIHPACHSTEIHGGQWAQAYWKSFRKYLLAPFVAGGTIGRLKLPEFGGGFTRISYVFSATIFLILCRVNTGVCDSVNLRIPPKTSTKLPGNYKLSTCWKRRLSNRLFTDRFVFWLRMLTCSPAWPALPGVIQARVDPSKGPQAQTTESLNYRKQLKSFYKLTFKINTCSFELVQSQTTNWTRQWVLLFMYSK